MTAQDYYIRITDVNPLQARVLETSKFSILSSQSYYKLLDIRKDKTAKIKLFEEKVVALVSSYNSLLELLPHHELILEEKKRLEPFIDQAPISNAKSPSKKTSLKNSSSKKPSTSKSKSTNSDPLSSLKKSLAAIEEKLSSLS
jgi:hypothetical protein